MTTGYLYDELGPYIEKDPDAVLDYPFDWSDWLATGDAIDTATVSSETVGIVASSSVDGAQVIAWLEGGAAGDTIRVTCNVVTTAGREDDRSIRLKIVEK